MAAGVTRFFGQQAAALAIAAAAGYGGNTALSPAGYGDLAKSEALVLTPYYDSVGVKTVCYGETKGVEDRLYTAEECGEMLVRRVENDFVPGILRCTEPRVWRSLGQKTKDAIIEFSWNVGIGGYCSSSVRKRLNAGYGAAACDRMLLWNKGRVNGKLRPLDGLTIRRKREAKKCHEGFVA